MIVFVGQNLLGSFALRGLLNEGFRPTLVVTRPPKAHSNDVVDVAERHQLEYIEAASLRRHSPARSRLLEQRPDVGVCTSWGERIDDELLAWPRAGWINAHPSLLPKYRGPSPIEWQLLAGEKRSGATVHVMTSSFDEGPILISDAIDVCDDDDGWNLRLKAGAAIERIISAGVRVRLAGSHGDPQKGPVRYAPKVPHPIFVDERMDLRSVRRQIHAFYPYPCVKFRSGSRVLALKPPTRFVSPDEQDKHADRLRASDLCEATLSNTGGVLTCRATPEPASE